MVSFSSPPSPPIMYMPNPCTRNGLVTEATKKADQRVNKYINKLLYHIHFCSSMHKLQHFLISTKFKVPDKSTYMTLVTSPLTCELCLYRRRGLSSNFLELRSWLVEGGDGRGGRRGMAVVEPLALPPLVGNIWNVHVHMHLLKSVLPYQ